MYRTANVAHVAFVEVDTADLTDTTGGPDARTFVAPSVVLTDVDDMVGTFVYLVPSFNDDPGVILMPGAGKAWFGNVLTLIPFSGVQPRGTHLLSEAWDGWACSAPAPSATGWRTPGT